MIDHVVIMAGGAGTRLWPASVRTRPKQFMRPTGGETLLETTIRRALALEPAGEIVIVTHHDHAALCCEEIATIPEAAQRVRVLAEPIGRNTAPAIALAANALPADDTMLVLSADHLIKPVDRFIADVAAADHAARNGDFVTFGIRPTRAETGYGYIEPQETAGNVSRVRAFREKPDAETAQRYFESGTYLWNAGIFVFPVGRFLSELRRFEPAVAEPLASITPRFFTIDTPHDAAPKDVYESLPGRSVDYAVMEHADAVSVVRASFEWSDVGSWDEIAQLVLDPPVCEPLAGGLDTDDPTPDARHGSAGSAAHGSSSGGRSAESASSVVLVESKNVHVDSDLPVAVCGLDDVSVVVRNGAVLVLRRGKAQLVKEAVDRFRERGMEEVL